MVDGMVGSLTKAHLDTVAVTLADQLRSWLTGVESLQRGMVGVDANALVGLGYTLDEANRIINVLVSMVQVKNAAAAYTENIYVVLGID
jgi:hypothetical protein